MKKYDFDIISIGLGPAGMAVSVMGSEMGFKVCAIEKENPGGECMNVGCIPSKAILKIAKTNPKMKNPFDHIQKHLTYIRDKKTLGMFAKATTVLKQGHAEFVDPHTVKVGEKTYSAKKIFIATGTKPLIPQIEGIEEIDYLTNNNLFELKSIPKSLIVVGGGAIGTEMADAFSKLGCTCKIVYPYPNLLPNAIDEAGATLEEAFKKQGIELYPEQRVVKVEKNDDEIVAITKTGEKISGERILLATGRAYDFSELKLENAHVEYGKKGIKVNKYLQTSQKHIYAVGDCNGHYLFSHAAMHQGMMGLINSMMPSLFRQDFRKYPVPWTVFTTPEVSSVGLNEKELKEKGIKYVTIEAKYGDYGAAIAEDVPEGFVKVFASKYGKIYGATIVGKNSGEMINEWTLAIQNKIRLHKMMLTMHSFPTMGFLSKRISEMWMMGLIKEPFMKKVLSFFR